MFFPAKRGSGGEELVNMSWLISRGTKQVAVDGFLRTLGFGDDKNLSFEGHFITGTQFFATTRLDLTID